MDRLNVLIKEKLNGLKTPREFAQAISDLGLELIDSGQLDSDEFIWEVARDSWKSVSNSAPQNFEEQVSIEFHKITEQL